MLVRFKGGSGEHPVVDELVAIDLDDLTPRQALDTLARLQKKAAKGKEP